MYMCFKISFLFLLDLGSLSDCTDCDPGYYCDAPGLTLPRAQCDPGYLCYSGATTSTPKDVATQGGERCTRGGYCLLGMASYMYFQSRLGI